MTPTRCHITPTRRHMKPTLPKSYWIFNEMSTFLYSQFLGLSVLAKIALYWAGGTLSVIDSIIYETSVSKKWVSILGKMRKILKNAFY